MNVGIAWTGIASGIAVVKDCAKNEIRRSASLPGGKNSPFVLFSPCEMKKAGARRLRRPPAPVSTW